MICRARDAKDIATEIEETMQYPGQIRVTVIRETRATTRQITVGCVLPLTTDP